MLRIVIITLLFCLCFFNTPTIAEEITNNPITEAQLQEGENIATLALKATEEGNFTLAEKYWSELIQKFPTNPAVWSNRGNARVSQNKLDEAISDYNECIKLAPTATDPYLNRGTAYEGLRKYDMAIADYEKVLSLDPEDAMAYNNLGNAKAALEDWQTAVKYYHKATELSPSFAFAGANESLALYQLGKKEEALKKMRNLVRKYPMFPDMRAALTAVLWEDGKQGEAESNWVATIGIDSRYKDIDWLKEVRRWPPNMIVALEKFLTLDGN